MRKKHKRKQKLIFNQTITGLEEIKEKTSKQEERKTKEKKKKNITNIYISQERKCTQGRVKGKIIKKVWIERRERR